MMINHIFEILLFVMFDVINLAKFRSHLIQNAEKQFHQESAKFSIKKKS